MLQRIRMLACGFPILTFLALGIPVLPGGEVQQDEPFRASVMIAGHMSSTTTTTPIGQTIISGCLEENQALTAATLYSERSARRIWRAQGRQAPNCSSTNGRSASILND